MSNSIKLMQKKNLQTFASHALPSTGKLEKEDLVVPGSFYEFERGNTRYFMTSSLHRNPVKTRPMPYFFSTDFKNYCSNPRIFPSAIPFFHLSIRFTINYPKQIKIIQQNMQLIKKYTSAHTKNAEKDI